MANECQSLKEVLWRYADSAKSGRQTWDAILKGLQEIFAAAFRKYSPTLAHEGLVDFGLPIKLVGGGAAPRAREAKLPRIFRMASSSAFPSPQIPSALA